MDTTKSPADRGKCQQGLKMSEMYRSLHFKCTSSIRKLHLAMMPF